MKVLFFAKYFYPHIGGVEVHVLEIAKILIRMGHSVTVFTEKFNNKLADSEYVHGIYVERFSHNKSKYFGLVDIWLQLYKYRKIFKHVDIVHCHDVFIWFLPFKILLNNRVYTTLHGWEGVWPIPNKNIYLKRLAALLSNKSVAVGEYINKYYSTVTNKIIYGGVKIPKGMKYAKEMRTLVFVGRLEKDTGVEKLLKWLRNNPGYKVDFCGDGILRSKCEKFGTVHGFTDPTPFYKKAKICVPGGYLAALEALSYDCELKLFWNNKLKEDYWKMSPFWKLKGEKLKTWAKQQTWEKIANEYLDLYNSIK